MAACPVGELRGMLMLSPMAQGLFASTFSAMRAAPTDGLSPAVLARREALLRDLPDFGLVVGFMGVKHDDTLEEKVARADASDSLDVGDVVVEMKGEKVSVDEAPVVVDESVAVATLKYEESKMSAVDNGSGVAISPVTYVDAVCAKDGLVYTEGMIVDGDFVCTLKKLRGAGGGKYVGFGRTKKHAKTAAAYGCYVKFVSAKSAAGFVRDTSHDKDRGKCDVCGIPDVVLLGHEARCAPVRASPLMRCESFAGDTVFRAMIVNAIMRSGIGDYEKYQTFVVSMMGGKEFQSMLHGFIMGVVLPGKHSVSERFEAMLTRQVYREKVMVLLDCVIGSKEFRVWFKGYAKGQNVVVVF